MQELLGFLPTWIAAALIPALAITTFFWKGDDAFSAEFKQWLGEKIVGAGAPKQEVSTTKTVGSIFDLVFGPRYFSSSGFLRVSAISFIATIIYYFATGGSLEALSFIYGDKWPDFFVLLLVASVFQYFSVMKARFIMTKVAAGGYGVILYFVLDAIATLVIAFMFFVVFDDLRQSFFKNSLFELYGAFDLEFAFFATAFIIFMLTIIYSVSLYVLRFFNSFDPRSSTAGQGGSTRYLLSTIFWVLPVKTLPVRSIGIIGGLIVFPVLLIAHIFT